MNRRTASGESVVVVVLRTALGIGLAEAAPVAGVNVILTRLDDGATATVQTDADGNFVFPNVVPGTYTITVQDPVTHQDIPVDPPDSFTVGAGDAANITGTVTESTVNVGNVTVVAVETDPTIVLANDAQTAHLLNIAKAAGLVSADPVLQLRQSGWGWGRIAKHFNVHPGVIGLGHAGVSDADIEAFRAAHGTGNGNNKGKGTTTNGQQQRQREEQRQGQGQEERPSLSRSASGSAPPGASPGGAGSAGAARCPAVSPCRRLGAPSRPLSGQPRPDGFSRRACPAEPVPRSRRSPAARRVSGQR